MNTKKTSVKRSTAKRKAPVKKAGRKTVENNQPRQANKKSSGPRPNNGGARSGAGRKVGAATKKTREIADQLAADGGLTPLAYLLDVLRTTDEDLKAQHDNGEIDTETYLVKLKFNMDRRDNAAEKACPYLHPRLSSVTAEVKGSEHDNWIKLMEEAGI
jgi:hypothetical protein